MKKNGLLAIGLIATTVALALQGCGGGSNNTPIKSATNKSSKLEPCKVDGNTVLAQEGKTCIFKQDKNEHKVKCENNRVILDDSINAKEININGTKYICE